MANAFITARRGICYLSIKTSGRTCDLLRIRAYTIDAMTKRDLRRVHPDIGFDWTKITRQLKVRGEQCRDYRSRRQGIPRPAAARSIRGVYDPATWTLYADGEPSTWREAAALLDAVLAADRIRATAKASEAPGGVEPKTDISPVSRSTPEWPQNGK